MLLCKLHADNIAYLKESKGKEALIIQLASGHHTKSRLPWKRRDGDSLGVSKAFMLL